MTRMGDMHTKLQATILFTDSNANNPRKDLT